MPNSEESRKKQKRASLLQRNQETDRPSRCEHRESAVAPSGEDLARLELPRLHALQNYLTKHGWNIECHIMPALCVLPVTVTKR